jgi:prepilin-type N-terminal cleavage/methylation domain-containing protein
MRYGFSLVELSIVLVILGLLTGGILSGQSLIRAAELRSVVTEYQHYNTAVHSFRNRYMALPGDMPNAVRFWGAQAGSTADGIDATCAALTTAATSAATCNGNGNGIIANGGSAYNVQQIEQFRFWQHLANAGLIEGSYSGIVGSGGINHSLIGINVPSSRISSVGWSARVVAAGDDATVQFNVGDSNRLLMGGQTSTAPSTAAAFSPEETWNIDTKLDDGRPGRGSFVAVRYSTCTTATTASMLDADYLLSSAGKLCAISFVKPF